MKGLLRWKIPSAAVVWLGVWHDVPFWFLLPAMAWKLAFVALGAWIYGKKEAHSAENKKT